VYEVNVVSTFTFLMTVYPNTGSYFVIVAEVNSGFNRHRFNIIGTVADTDRETVIQRTF